MTLRCTVRPIPQSIPTRGWLLAMWLAVGALTLHAVRGQAQSAPLEDLSSFPQTELTIRSGHLTHPFTLWIANTPSRDEQGLMFVRELPPDRGMVFLEAQPKVWTMWMRNTYIPLDMLFIADDGRVVKIAHAIPHDDTTISSEVVVHAVIELKGGICEQLHIQVGDVAKWKAPAASDPNHLRILSNP